MDVDFDFGGRNVELVSDCGTPVVLDMQSVGLVREVGLERDHEPFPDWYLNRLRSVGRVGDELEVEVGLAHAGLECLLELVEETEGALRAGEDEDLPRLLVLSAYFVGVEVEVELGCP